MLLSSTCVLSTTGNSPLRMDTLETWTQLFDVHDFALVHDTVKPPDFVNIGQTIGHALFKPNCFQPVTTLLMGRIGGVLRLISAPRVRYYYK